MGNTPTDPVCGMYVPENTDLFLEKDGRKYYFCSKGCMDKFASPEKEIKKLKERLAVAWTFSVPVLLITYLTFLSVPYRNYILLFLAIPVQFFSGLGFYDGAIHSIKNRSANMDLLVSLGTLTAFFFSLFITVFPDVIRSAGVYFDASSFIITMILTGNYIESITKQRANRSAMRLIDMIPDTAHIVRENGKIEDIKSDLLKPGDIISVRVGEIFPVDGEVLDGESDVDKSILTGEQNPVTAHKGDMVFSGTKNLNGTLNVKVINTGRDSTLSQIYELIQRASSGRAKVQRIADVFSSYFVPAVLISAFASAIFWFLYLRNSGYAYPLEIAVLAFVSVVVIACPCAIGLAGPITLLISSSISSESGIVIKNSSSLDRLSKVNRVIFDKTGTLTENTPSVTEISFSGNLDENETIQLAASLESQSNHPAGRAIVNMATEKGIDILKAWDVKEIPGKGIEGVVNGKMVQVMRNDPGTDHSIKIMVDKLYCGGVRIEYELRNGAKETVKKLQSMGIGVSIVSGDARPEVERIGNILGVTDIYSEVLPDQKSEIIKDLQNHDEYVMFVGDGINDAVALETADVGVAMGSGSDIARDSGDIILLNNQIENIVKLRIIGEDTISKIKQNIGWAFGYNTVLIPVAAGIPVAFFGLAIYGFLPILGAFAMGMSSVSVVMNSMLLRRKINKSMVKYFGSANSPV